MILRPRVTVRTLLLASFTFVLFTFLSQILFSSGTKSSLIIETSRSVINCSLSGHQDEQLIIDDLRLTERSLLKELKKLEVKRRRVLRSLRKLQSECDALSVKHAQLTEKNLLVRHKLIHNTVRLEKVNLELDQRFETINLLKTSVKTNLVEMNSTECSDCLDLTMCDSKPLIYLHSDSTSHSVFKQLDRSIISHSADLTTNPSDASRSCLVVVFLSSQSVEFIKNHQYKNLLLLESVDSTFNLTQISSKLESSIFVSIRQHVFKQASLLINFPFGIRLDSAPSSDRSYLLTYHQSTQDSELQSSHLFDKRIVIDTRCTRSQYNLCFNVTERLAWLARSKYTIILSHTEPEELVIRLVEAIKCETVPVVVNSEHVKLPLEDLIDWRMVLVRVPARQLPRLVFILDSIKEHDYLSRQMRARNIYNAYFASLTLQFRTILAACLHKLEVSPPVFHIEEKELVHKGASDDITMLDDDDDNLVEDESPVDEYLGEINQPPVSSPHYAANFTLDIHSAWNVYYYPFNLFPSTPFDQNPVSSEARVNNYDARVEEIDANFTIGGGDGRVFQHHLGGNYPEEQFTMMILSYKRENILSDLLEKYLRLPYLHSILVIWNSPDLEMSYRFTSKFHFYLLSGRLRVIKSKTNSLCNRFKPYPSLIHTDAVLSMDDDMYLRPDEIMLAFRVWRENRDRIVGLPARYHTWNATRGQFEYKSYLTCEYSMVLTGAAFYHRFYNYMFTYAMRPEIREKIDELMNCEDIAFNMLVAHLTRRPPIKVGTKYSFYCKECDWILKSDRHDMVVNASMNSVPVSQRTGHYEKRSECVRYFTHMYGYNPLLYSQYRADSVLYKTRLGASVQRCFKFV